MPFYLLSGFGSGLASIAYKQATNTLIGSVGASGCIMGMIAASTLLHPNASYGRMLHCFETLT